MDLRPALIADLPVLGEIQRQAIMAQPESFWDKAEKLKAAEAWAKMEIHSKFEEYKVLILSDAGNDIAFVGWRDDYLGYLLFYPHIKRLAWVATY